METLPTWEEINTAGDEMFPYVAEDGKLLFCIRWPSWPRKARPFLAVRAGGKITVENMGIPYNSNMDDFGLVMSKRGDVFSRHRTVRVARIGDDVIITKLEKPDLADNDDPSNPLLSLKGNQIAPASTRNQDS